MPLPVGSITPVVAFAAMAASTALPPRSRICTPAAAASGWLEATTPYREATTDLPGTGSRAAAAFADDAAARTKSAISMASLWHLGDTIPGVPSAMALLPPRLTAGYRAPMVGPRSVEERTMEAKARLHCWESMPKERLSEKLDRRIITGD